MVFETIPFSEITTHRIVRCGLVKREPIVLKIEDFQILACMILMIYLPPEHFQLEASPAF